MTFELSKTFLFDRSLKNDEILLQNFQTAFIILEFSESCFCWLTNRHPLCGYYFHENFVLDLF